MKTELNQPTEQVTHTPGPWTATEAGIFANELNAHGNFYVCALPFPNEEPDARDAANLRLIAAAPELAQQLNESIYMIERLRGWIKAIADRQKTADRAIDIVESSGQLNEGNRNAIAKAKGQS